MARYGWGGDQWLDNNGKPLSQGKLFFYDAGTVSAKVTYSDSAMTVPHTHPVGLDGAGRQPDIFFAGNAKIVITTSTGALVSAPTGPVTPIAGSGDPITDVDITALSLTVLGDSDLQGTLDVGPNLTDIRTFKMGFTTWPYDFTEPAYEFTYEKLNAHGDIITHHLTQGLPWDEAYADSPTYPAWIEADIAGRLAGTGVGKDVFLAVDSLTQFRDALIGEWGSGGQVARTAPWDTRDFDSPEVIEAFINYSLNLIARFNPTHYSYGTEVIELFVIDPAAYTKYVAFAAGVYAGIKAVHPDLKVMCSIILKNPDTAESISYRNQFARIANYTDVVGVSIYPYAFFSPLVNVQPSDLAANWLTQINAIAPGKPIAITETGWIGQTINIPAPVSLAVTSSPAIQAQYVEMMLQAARLLDAEFVIWWCVADFEDGWLSTIQYIPGAEAAQIWEFMGLYDPNQVPRIALATWDNWLAKPITNPSQSLASLKDLDVTWNINTRSIVASGNIFAETVQANAGIVTYSLFALTDVTAATVNTGFLNVSDVSFFTANVSVVNGAGISADNVAANVLLSAPALIVTDGGTAVGAIDNLTAVTIFTSGAATLGSVGTGALTATTIGGTELTVNDVDTDTVQSNVSVVAEGGLADTRLYIGVFASDEANVVVLSSTTVADPSPATAGLLPMALNCTNLEVNASGEIFLNLPTSAGTTGSLWNDAGTVKVAP
jgi:hypothetical protein